MTRSSVRIVLVAVLAAGATAGCSRSEGPAEQAGKKIDQAMQEAGKKVDAAVTAASAAVTTAGEKVGGAVNQAVDATGKAVEQTGQQMQDAAKK